jgi:hypothetical protein
LKNATITNLTIRLLKPSLKLQGGAACHSAVRILKDAAENDPAWVECGAIGTALPSPAFMARGNCCLLDVGTIEGKHEHHTPCAAEIRCIFHTP